MQKFQCGETTCGEWWKLPLYEHLNHVYCENGVLPETTQSEPRYSVLHGYNFDIDQTRPVEYLLCNAVSTHHDMCSADGMVFNSNGNASHRYYHVQALFPGLTMEYLREYKSDTIQTLSEMFPGHQCRLRGHNLIDVIKDTK